MICHKLLNLDKFYGFPKSYNIIKSGRSNGALFVSARQGLIDLISVVSIQRQNGLAVIVLCEPSKELLAEPQRCSPWGEIRRKPKAHHWPGE